MFHKKLAGDTGSVQVYGYSVELDVIGTYSYKSASEVKAKGRGELNVIYTGTIDATKKFSAT